MTIPTTFKYLLVVCFLSVIWNRGSTQIPDLKGAKNFDKFEIPFDYENNFIIIKLLFNGVFPLRFILDTGAEHTILTKREITDLLQVDYTRRFTLIGADMQTELYAYLAPGVSLKANELHAINRSILVLEDDYFHFEEFTGIDIQGILGADFFRRFIMHIDYRRQVITLYNPAEFDLSLKKYVEVPIELKRNKPYVSAQAVLNPDTTAAVKLLIDTGASLAIMLYTSTHPKLAAPAKSLKTNIGMGLGGYIEGIIGRLSAFEIGPYSIGEVITNFQEVIPVIDSSYLNDRNGLLGNQILNKFDVVINYITGKMYLQPNKNFKKKFEYDKSGLSIAAGGTNLSSFRVYSVVEGSPADEAGVLEGDQILSVNRIPAGFLDLNQVIRKLRRKEGKKIRLKIKRGEEKMIFVFRLQKLI